MFNKKTQIHALTGFCLALTAAPALAGPFFTSSNQGAFARSFLLPALGEHKVQLAKDWVWTAQLDQTSEYVEETLLNESITLDGESTRLGYTLTQGLDNGFEWGFEMPVYYNGEGFMDSFIEDWHDWFGLPNGGRELAPQDRYLYAVVRNGAVVYRNVDTGAAFGDLRVNGAWQWTPKVALRASLKFPTGSERRQTGDNFGGALWADMALPFAEGSSWSGFFSIGGSGARRGDILPELQETVVAIGGFGLSYACTDRFSLTAQLNAHSALYQDSDLEALERPGLQATFGGSYLLMPNALLRVAVQEDPVTSSSPDFSLHIGLTVSPKALNP